MDRETYGELFGKNMAQDERITEQGDEITELRARIRELEGQVEFILKYMGYSAANSEAKNEILAYRKGWQPE